MYSNNYLNVILHKLVIGFEEVK